MSNEYLEERKAKKKSNRSMAMYEIWRRIQQTLFGKFQQRKNINAKTKRLIFIWGMLLPSIIAFIVFWLYVNFDAILLAFKDIDFEKGGVEYWTFDQFKRIYRYFTDDSLGIDMFHYFKNTMKYWLVGMVWGLPHSILLTYAFYKKITGSKFYRVMLYVPGILSSVVLGGIFESFISNRGVFGTLLREFFGVERVPAWFREDAYATKMLIFYTVFFGFAGSYIIFSGAMARISTELIEAAYMDGVTMWQEIWYILIPQMWPTLSIHIVTSFAGIFGASGPILLFTPSIQSTHTLGYFIFDQVRTYNSYYLPAALGLTFTLVAFPISLWLRNTVDKIYSED